MPSSVVKSGLIVHENSFAVTQVEPEVEEAVLEAEHEEVGGRRKVIAASPEKEAVGGNGLHTEAKGIFRAEDTERKTCHLSKCVLLIFVELIYFFAKFSFL